MKLKETLLTREQLDKAAKVLKVLAHPVKLEILQVLRDNPPMDVSSLCKSLGAECEISMMSHHLAKMKDNGVLNSVKQGKRVFYSIADRSLLSIFECMSKCALI